MDHEQTQHSPPGHKHSPSSSTSGSTSTEPVRSRWSPKPEQILILESIFNSGMVNPPKQETVRIRKMLEKFGAVGDANVFYWFQNRRSRSRRRQRQIQAAAAAATATTANTCDQTMMVSTSLPQHCGNDLGFGGCSTSSNYLFGGSSQQVVPSYFIALSSSSSCCFKILFCFLFSLASPSSYGGGCDNLLTMSSQMGYHEANHYQDHSSNVASILSPPHDQNSNFQYQQGVITVFINGVPTEVARGGIDMKSTFGQDLVLVHSSGFPLPIDEFGFLMHSLQHGEAYFLVPRQT
ncbi:unnamed protein product [Cochlearia groenlandica]